MATKIGLLAGRGELPLLAWQGIIAAGDQPLVAAIAGEASPELLAKAGGDAVFPLGALTRVLEFFRSAGVKEVVFAGKVQKTQVFTGRDMDPALLALLASLPQKNDDAILGAVVDCFARAGLTVLPQAAYLKDLLTPVGVLSKRAPDARERADIGFGFAMAKKIGDIDCGQSVVVKNGAILAVEAVEGTDAAVRRGGALGHGGAVLVKVSKPRQDPRFDVPTVGPDTITSMIEAGVSVLAIEAGATFCLDRAACLARAEASGLSVVAVDNDGSF